MVVIRASPELDRACVGGRGGGGGGGAAAAAAAAAGLLLDWNEEVLACGSGNEPGGGRACKRHSGVPYFG